MSRTLPLHTCDVCGKTTFCWNCGDHYECNSCCQLPHNNNGTDSPQRVEGYCRTGGIHRPGYLKWVKKYRNPGIKI